MLALLRIHYVLNLDPDPGIFQNRIWIQALLNSMVNIWIQIKVFMTLMREKWRLIIYWSIMIYFFPKHLKGKFKIQDNYRELFFSSWPACIRIRIPNPGPDPLTQLNPDLIRTRDPDQQHRLCLLGWRSDAIWLGCSHSWTFLVYLDPDPESGFQIRTRSTDPIESGPGSRSRNTDYAC